MKAVLMPDYYYLTSDVFCSISNQEILMQTEMFMSMYLRFFGPSYI